MCVYTTKIEIKLGLAKLVEWVQFEKILYQRWSVTLGNWYFTKVLQNYLVVKTKRWDDGQLYSNQVGMNQSTIVNTSEIAHITMHSKLFFSLNTIYMKRSKYLKLHCHDWWVISVGNLSLHFHLQTIASALFWGDDIAYSCPQSREVF